MFPMIATCDEFERAKDLVLREKAYLDRHGHALPDSLSLGVMIEVPSLLFRSRRSRGAPISSRSARTT
jgi:phosphotransferase system enzyme I (PtsP)